ncbi:hypothetical protein B6U91_00015 [Candidatus Pacearchaeota archaeon ex4484_71]|nr:MAG: hypothetical protein B6U91_00015 [Candidatus Pacearchaeota archaeon ex4484_71]
MRILVIGDLHGRMPKIHFKQFDCIVCVGDFSWDGEIGEIYKSLFKKGNKSSYEEYIDKYVGKRNLRRMEKESLARGRKILEYLNSFGKPVFIVPGNWDQSYGETRIKDIEKTNYNYLKAFYDWWLGDKTNPALTKGLKNIKDCQYKNHKFSGVNFLGYGLVSAYESLNIRKKKIKKQVNEEEYEKLRRAYGRIHSKLDNVFKSRDKKMPTMFITHNVPYNTKLDVIKDKASSAHNKHAGSSLAREMCIRYKPLVCVGGHIHEHFGKDRIGKTVVINAGFGKDANTLIDLNEETGKIRKIEFYKGYKKVKK